MMPSPEDSNIFTSSITRWRTFESRYFILALLEEKLKKDRRYFSETKNKHRIV